MTETIDTLAIGNKAAQNVRDALALYNRLLDEGDLELAFEARQVLENCLENLGDITKLLNESRDAANHGDE